MIQRTIQPRIQSDKRTARVAARLSALGLWGALLVGAGCGGAKGNLQLEAGRAPTDVTALSGVARSAVEAFEEGLQALRKRPPDYEFARGRFQISVDKDAKFIEGYLNLAATQLRLGQVADAERTLRNAQGVRDDVRVDLALAGVVRQKGQLDDARSILEASVRKHTEDARPKNGLAALLRAQKQYSPALKYVQEVLARNPRDVDALNNLGLIFFEQGNASMAMMIFTKGLEIDKRSAVLNNNFGLVSLKQGNVGVAAAHFQRAIESDPLNYAARLNLGAIFLENLDFNGAVNHFQAALAEQPRSLEANLGLGTAHYGAKRWKEAAVAFESALGVSQDNAQALVALGRIYHERLSESQKALGFYRRYLARGNVAANDTVHVAIREIQAGKKAAVESSAKPKVVPKPKAPDGKPPAASPPPPPVAPPAVKPAKKGGQAGQAKTP